MSGVERRQVDDDDALLRSGEGDSSLSIAVELNLVFEFVCREQLEEKDRRKSCRYLLI